MELKNSYPKLTSQYKSFEQQIINIYMGKIKEMVLGTNLAQSIHLSPFICFLVVRFFVSPTKLTNEVNRIFRICPDPLNKKSNIMYHNFYNTFSISFE